MATFGCKYFTAAPITSEPTGALPYYGDPITFDELQRVSYTDNIAEGTQSGDNKTVEYMAEYVDTDIETGLCNLGAAAAAAIFGNTLTAGAQSAPGTISCNADDDRPYLGIGAIECKLVHGVYQAIGHYWPKVKAKPTTREFTTREKGSVTLNGETVAFKAMECDNGDYHQYSEPFTASTRAAAEASAKTWVNNLVKKHTP